MTQVIQTDLSNLDIDERNRIVIRGMKKVSKAFMQIASDVDEFELLPEHLVPEGIMEKTRSVSWLVEQIYVQQINKKPEKYGFSAATIPDDDSIIYDLIVELDDINLEFSINMKAFDSTSGSTNKDDVSKASKIANYYYNNIGESRHHLIVKTGIDIDGKNRKVKFDSDAIEVYNLQWIRTDDLYVNHSNKNLQCKLIDDSQVRDRKKFIEHLLKSEQGIIDAVENRSANEELLQEEQLGFDYSQFI